MREIRSEFTASRALAAHCTQAIAARLHAGRALHPTPRLRQRHASLVMRAWARALSIVLGL